MCHSASSPQQLPGRAPPSTPRQFSRRPLKALLDQLPPPWPRSVHPQTFSPQQLSARISIQLCRRCFCAETHPERARVSEAKNDEKATGALNLSCCHFQQKGVRALFDSLFLKFHLTFDSVAVGVGETSCSIRLYTRHANFH